METIFVQITSYRDPQCQWTVKDLFEKASHPERISVGICWQFDEQEDKAACFEQPYPYPHQVRSLAYHPRESKGASWARMQAWGLWRGEDYVLSIDAHMRFEPGWDEKLIETLARCPSPHPVLSTYLPAYRPPNTPLYCENARTAFVGVRSVIPEGDPQIVHLDGKLLSKDAPLIAPIRSAFMVANFLFARSRLMLEVPFDPYIFFYGDEITYSARLFTHGYDVFQPDAIILYHLWERKPPAGDNYKALRDDRTRRNLMRVRHLLRLKASQESAAIADLEHYGLGEKRSLDDFWRFSGINPVTGEIARYAQEGKWEGAYQQLAQKSPAAPRPRIFVQIASYRDPECQWTVKDLFEKASHPERVSVGICWQFDPQEDRHCFAVSTRPSQVRVTPFHWKESKGVCWARRQTQLLWQGEEYTLCIDSHMRFEFGWDEKMIAELAECASPKPLLTGYPPRYQPPHDLETPSWPTVQRANLYSPQGDMRFHAGYLKNPPPKPLRGAFIAAGLMFAKSDVIREVPYDPYLYFGQEEVSMAARFFTHGFDSYCFREVLAYHYYNTPKTDKKKRPVHWDDERNAEAVRTEEKKGAMETLSRKRLDHLLGHKLSDDPEVTRDLTLYDLGQARTLAEYEDFCGIDFKNRVVSERALRCHFIPDLAKYMGGPFYVPEVDDPKRKNNAEPAPGLVFYACRNFASHFTP